MDIVQDCDGHCSRLVGNRARYMGERPSIEDRPRSNEVDAVLGDVASPLVFIPLELRPCLSHALGTADLADVLRFA